MRSVCIFTIPTRDQFPTAQSSNPVFIWFIFYLLFNITITPNPYPWSVSCCRIRSGGNWGRFPICTRRQRNFSRRAEFPGPAWTSHRLSRLFSSLPILAGTSFADAFAAISFLTNKRSLQTRLHQIYNKICLYFLCY